MKRTSQRTLILLVTILVMVVSLFHAGTVFADDGQPPVEPVVTQEPVATDVPAATEEPLATDIPVATVDPVLTAEPEEEETEVQEILQQIPEGTEVIALNEEGQPEPLVTEDAVEIILTSDPMWCPTGQVPGDAGCTAGYATATQLIAALNGVTGDGTIYFTSTYSTNDLTFDQFYNSNLSGLGALTIQGGWNGSSGNAFALSGSTLFSGVGITITNWNGNITLSDVVVDGAIGDGITIYYANSDIQLTNVSSNNNSNDGFYIESNGEITSTNLVANDNYFAGAVLYGGEGVTLNGTNTFNNNENSYGLGVFSYTDIVLANIIANSNGGMGVYIDNTAGSGNVTLNGSNIFNGNIEGLHVLSTGDITASNIEAINNTGSGANIDNNLSGGNGSVVISGTSIFDANGNYGLIVHSSEDIDVSNVTANDNTDYGMYLDNCNDFGVGCTGNGDVIISGINIFNGNGQSGVNVVSNGNITIENVMANENNMSGISLIGYGSPVTVSSSVFNSNGYYGIDAEYVSASMLLDNVSFDCLNGLGDYIYGSTVFNACTPVEESPTGSEISDNDLSLHMVFANNIEKIELDCELYSGTKFILPNGSSLVLPCPIMGTANMTENTSDTLPGLLPRGSLFQGAFTIAISEKGESLNKLSKYATVSFVIPNEVDPSSLAILYWDGFQWVEVDTAISSDGHLVALVDYTGTFVLVKK